MDTRSSYEGYKTVKTTLFCFALISTGIVGAAPGLGADTAPAAEDYITESEPRPRLAV